MVQYLRLLAFSLIFALSTQPLFAQDTATPTMNTCQLLVTNSHSNTISLVDPEVGVTQTLEVGSAPWAIALSPDNRAYVSTDAGVAVVDVTAWTLEAFVPYNTPVRTGRFGEYREGGMALVLSPDGKTLYVGVYTGGRTDQLEVLNTSTLEFTASVPIGIRPFDVVMTPDGQHVISIDHDSYSATVIDTETLTPVTVELAPLGFAAYDKPHYAAVANDGHLWLPYQGRTLVNFDPLTGDFTISNLSASTHQHGTAFTPDQSRLLIVGTGAAGEVSNPPSLTIVEMDTLQEMILPLAKAHEKVIVSPDGKTAYLSGGYLLNGGWDGITVMDLETYETREIPVPDAPLDMVIVETSE